MARPWAVLALLCVCVAALAVCDAGAARSGGGGDRGGSDRGGGDDAGGVGRDVPGGPRIKRVVVLMLENRSFDHMLGWMKQTYNATIDGLTGAELNRYNSSDPLSRAVPVAPNSTYIAPIDPSHSYAGTLQQVYGDAFDCTAPAQHRSMGGFVENALANYPSRNPSSVMHVFQESAVPVISALAREFALFDRWHCSLPGPTNPNRQFLHAGTAAGNLCADDFNAIGFGSKTIFNLLHETNRSARIYYSDWSPLCMFRSLRSPPYKAMFRPLDTFVEHAMAGDLAEYSFLEPRMFPTFAQPASDQHPDHDVREGEQLLKEVYEALRNGPLWNETLFVVTYDEHGGFYDHVPPPTEGVPPPDSVPAWNCGGEGFKYDRLGVRVPTIVISPWVERGVIVHEPAEAQKPTPFSRFDHTSVLATLKKVFGWDSFLTKRDEWAATFEDVFSGRATPRTDCPTTLPSVPPRPSGSAAAEATKPPNDLQAEFFNISASCYPHSQDAAGRPLTAGSFATQHELTLYMRDRFERFLAAPATGAE